MNKFNLPNLLTYSFGLNVAIVYTIIKTFGYSKSIESFFFACVLISLLYLFLKLIKKEKITISFYEVLRGILLGSSQILVFFSLENLKVTSAFGVLTSGFIISNVFAKFILKESYNKNDFLVIVCCLFGLSFYMTSNINLMFIIVAFMGGLLSGSSLSISRYLKNQGYYNNSIMLNSMIGSSLITGGFLFFGQSKSLFPHNYDFILFAVLLLIIQNQQLFLVKRETVLTASMISLTRIFWAAIIDMFLGEKFSSFEILAALIIVLSSTFKIYRDKPSSLRPESSR